MIGIIALQRALSISKALSDQKWVKVKTPFGAPSDEFLTATLPDATGFFSRAPDAASHPAGELTTAPSLGMKKPGSLGSQL